MYATGYLDPLFYRLLATFPFSFSVSVDTSLTIKISY